MRFHLYPKSYWQLTTAWGQTVSFLQEPDSSGYHDSVEGPILTHIQTALTQLSEVFGFFFFSNQWQERLAALPKDLSSIPSTQMAAHDYVLFQ